MQFVEIGNFSIRMYGVIFALGVLMAYFVIQKLFKLAHPSFKNIDSLLFTVLLTGLLGARLYHVFDVWEYYSKNLTEIIAIWNGGIGIYGGLIGGFLGLLIYTKIKKLSILSILDVLTPGVALAQSIGRWGNFFNQEAYGYPSNSLWAIKIDPANRLPGFEKYEYYHPTFLYESLMLMLAFIALFFLFRKRGRSVGLVFACYLFFYGITRLITEQFRIDTWQHDGIKVAQVISISFIIVGSFLIWYFHKFSKSR